MTEPLDAEFADHRPDAITRSNAPADGLGAFDLLKDVTVELTLEIGRRRMKIADVLQLSSGSTIELDKAAGEPVDIYVNGQLLGRGEAVVVGDRYGVRITEIVSGGRK
ncbi:MAG: flagellar motor switch protein FliN [Myxococcales bacterium]|nr:flagellar motor switch protein FliN [Myxococcales bacterium]